MWQRKHLGERRFVCVAGKGVTGMFFRLAASILGCVAGKEVRDAGGVARRSDAKRESRADITTE